MFSVFWKSLFVTFLAFILFTNIVFAFDLVHVINPSALSFLEENEKYSDYYFGMQSFIDAWESFFGNEESFLSNFNDFLINTGDKFATLFQENGVIDKVLKISRANDTSTMLRALVTIAMLLISGWPVLLLVAYGVLWVAYLALFAIEVILFILSFFGGAFRTPLPSTDWYDYHGDWPWIESTTESLRYIKALMV